ncbi:MAG: glycoside hydrolase family 20 zincin-like fold domain-containing protein [bacterium]
MKNYRCVIAVFFLFYLPFSLLSQIQQGQSPPPTHGLKLIPQPQQVRILSGLFEWYDAISIVISDHAEESERFAAEQLADEIHSVLDYTCTIRSKGQGIHLGLFTRDTHLLKAVEHFPEDMLKKLGSQGYFLEIQKDQIFCLAPTSTGLFYGVQTLKQLIRANMAAQTLPRLWIADWPALKYRGWQDDISRGPIPTMDFLKKQIRTMAEFKMNMMTLYTEHVFKLRSHPNIAPDDGITSDEIQKLVNYAEKYHITIIGNFQSFGHFYHILRLPKYQHLQETEHVISPAFEETYEFLSDALSEVSRAYESRFFNINCDETFGLGTGPAKTMVDSMGKDGVYAYHINRIYDMLEPFQKRIMMWGDIALEYPGIISQLPEDLIVLTWGYNPAESFEKEIIPFTEMEFDFMVCPGVNCWRRIWPDFKAACINISNFVRDGALHGALGMLNTSWDDDGENLFSYHWYPLIWGAECAWNPIVPQHNESMERVRADRLQSFDLSFDPLFFCHNGYILNKLMRNLSELRALKAADGLNNSTFWKPIINKSDELIPYAADADSLYESSAEIASKLNGLKKETARFTTVVESAWFAAQRIRYLAYKHLLAQQIDNFIHNQPESSLTPEKLKNNINTLYSQILNLKKEYSRLWKKENRPWWLDQNLKKYDSLAEHIQSLNNWIFITPDTLIFQPDRSIRLSPLFHADALYYTLDNSDPDFTSQKYEAPFTLNKTTSIKARALVEGELQTVNSREIFVYKGPADHIQLSYPFEPQYRAHGLISLVDGKRGSDSFRDGNWLGFLKNDFEAVIRLKRPIPLSRLSLGCLQNTPSWILFPEEVEFYLSDDNKEFISVGKVRNKTEWNQEGAILQSFTVNAHGKPAQWIKIIARNCGQLPSWHKSAGEDSWIFVDEILVE